MKKLMLWLAVGALCVGISCWENCYPTFGGGYSCTMTYVPGAPTN
jgi:hypothetical protein